MTIVANRRYPDSSAQPSAGSSKYHHGGVSEEYGVVCVLIGVGGGVSVGDNLRGLALFLVFKSRKLLSQAVIKFLVQYWCQEEQIK